MSRQPRIMGAPMTAANEAVFLSLTRELRALGRSERTVSTYHQACLSLERHADGADLLEITRNEILAWLTALRATHASNSIRSYFRSVRAFYNWAVREELIPTAPTARLPVPKGSGKPVPLPDTGHLRLLIAACERDETWMGRRDEAIIRFCCQIGAPRSGEVVALLAADVDLETEMATVTGKTGSRTFPLELKTARAFSRWTWARRRQFGETSPRFFVGSRGDLTPAGIYQLTERRCAEAGIPRIHPHQFRHWATDQALRAGIPEGAIVVLNGWTSRKMLDRYGAAAASLRATAAARATAIGAVL